MRIKITSVVLIWLTFWAMLSNFSLGGLYSPGFDVNFVVALGLFGFWIGTKLTGQRRISGVDCWTDAPRALVQIHTAFKITAVICASVQFILVLKFLKIFLEDRSLLNRQDLFGNIDNPSILFESQPLALLYLVFIQTAQKIAIVTGFALSFYTKKIRYILIGNVLCLVDSLLFLGRGALLEFIFQMLFYVLISRELRQKMPRYFKKFILLFVPCLIILGSVIGVLRGDADSVDLNSFLKNQVVNYHTVGFVILDQELTQPQSRLNNNMTFGLATLGGIERLLVLGIRRVDKSIDSVSGKNGEYLAEFRVVGADENSNDLNYNAFGTIFYTFILDGGLFYVFCGMLVFGVWLAKERLWFLNGRFANVTTLYVLFQAALNALFFSPIESTTFWLVIVALYFIRKRVPTNVRAYDSFKEFSVRSI